MQVTIILLVPAPVPPGNFLTSALVVSPVSTPESDDVENAVPNSPVAVVIIVPDGAFDQAALKSILVACIFPFVPKFSVPIFLYYTITHAPSSVIVEPSVTGPAFNAFLPVPI